MKVEIRGVTPQLYSWQVRPAAHTQPACLQATPWPHWNGCILAPRKAPARPTYPHGDHSGQESGGSSVSWCGGPGPGGPPWEETGLPCLLEGGALRPGCCGGGGAQDPGTPQGSPCGKEAQKERGRAAWPVCAQACRDANRQFRLGQPPITAWSPSHCQGWPQQPPDISGPKGTTQW